MFATLFSLSYMKSEMKTSSNFSYQTQAKNALSFKFAHYKMQGT